VKAEIKQNTRLSQRNRATLRLCKITEMWPPVSRYTNFYEVRANFNTL